MPDALNDFVRWIREKTAPPEGASYFERRVISSVPQTDGTFYVTLSCGHAAIWIVKPYSTLTPCAQCVNEYVERYKQEQTMTPCGECGGTGEIVNDGPYSVCDDCNGSGREANNKMIYIGIDPGVTGAVAALDDAGRVLSLQDTPTIQERVGKHVRNTYADSGMAALLEGIVRSDNKLCCSECCAVDREEIGSDRILVTIENVHAMPKQGVASSFSFGAGFGVWRGIIAALGLPYQRVEPAVWKRAMGLTNSKGAAVSKALKLFPRAEIGHTYRGRMIYSDGRAEALLIAHYAATAGRTERKAGSARAR